MIDGMLSEPMAATEREDSVRRSLTGGTPLAARLHPWMISLLAGDRLFGLVNQYGSPLNVLDSAPMKQNVLTLLETAEARQIEMRVFFARKSNKCLAMVDAARELKIGIDTASFVEIDQTLARGIPSSDIICTAAVKDQALVDRALGCDPPMVLAIDNEDELNLVLQRAQSLSVRPRIALRLGGFHHGGRKLDTRFGFDVDRDAAILEHVSDLPVDVCGLHFHLDGYDGPQRVSALSGTIRWWDRLRELGHHPMFIDMGGGFPMRYLQFEEQWNEFWQSLRQALLGKREPVTYKNHGLGLTAHEGHILGHPNSYPYYQSPVFDQWFGEILDADHAEGTVADALRSREIELRCEPGRSLMDGCGMTVARVEFRKQASGGDWLIGLSMNRTQCRTTSDDFLVDPILVPLGGQREPTSADAIEGYLVGAYCMESELLTWRKLRFPHGVQRGDLIVFPNTAGYLMHFLESRSHQFPLAKNLIRGDNDSFELDAIDS